MHNDKYDDLFFDYSGAWAPANLHHDEYLAEKKKEQQKKEAEKAEKEARRKRKMEKGKEPHFLWLLIHALIFQVAFRAKYSDYVDWYVNHNDDWKYYSRASFVRILSVVLIPVAYIILDRLYPYINEMFIATEESVYLFLLLFIPVFTVVVIVGLWKASTIEFTVIESAKEKAKAIRLENSTKK